MIRDLAVLALTLRAIFAQSNAPTAEPTEDPTMGMTTDEPIVTLTDEDCNGLYNYDDGFDEFVPRTDSYTFDVQALLSLFVSLSLLISDNRNSKSILDK